ncbi:hypothetical protein Bca101_073036 [Brassica carinata]
MIQKHELTLVGRVTNLKYQRVWSLIPFFSNMWKTSSRPIGADLGQGLFQSQFANAEDMALVLEKRPYHFAKWMVILQKWEPTMSASFPSQIPFWIRVHGVPLHLWREDILRRMGEDLGIYLGCDITPGNLRMRVQINGLLPILKQYTLEFAAGGEIIATLVYEKLDKHCLHCSKLDHEEEGCPELVEQRRVNAGNVHLRDREPGRQDRYQVPSARHNHDERRDNQYREEQGQRRFDRPRGQRDQYSLEGRERSHRSVGPYDSRGTRAYETGSKGDRSYLKEGAHHNSSRREERWVDSGRRFPTTNRTVDSFGSRSGEPFSETGRRNLNKERQPNNPEDGVIPRSPLKSVKTHAPKAAPQLEEIPNEVLEVAREELREVMIQYTSCADPTESAARRERVRRAEEQGEVEETAENMARQMLNVQRTGVQAEIPEVVPPRVPATCRLGGVSLSDQEGEMSSQQGRVSAKKRLGRPPLVRKLGVNSTRTGAVSTKSRKVAQLKGSPKRRVGRQTVNSKKTELLNQAVGASTSNPKTSKPKTKQDLERREESEVRVKGGETVETSSNPLTVNRVPALRRWCRKVSRRLTLRWLA